MQDCAYLFFESGRDHGACTFLAKQDIGLDLADEQQGDVSDIFRINMNGVMLRVLFAYIAGDLIFDRTAVDRIR